MCLDNNNTCMYVHRNRQEYRFMHYGFCTNGNLSLTRSLTIYVLCIHFSSCYSFGVAWNSILFIFLFQSKFIIFFVYTMYIVRVAVKAKTTSWIVTKALWTPVTWNWLRWKSENLVSKWMKFFSCATLF